MHRQEINVNARSGEKYIKTFFTHKATEQTEDSKSYLMVLDVRCCTSPWRRALSLALTCKPVMFKNSLNS